MEVLAGRNAVVIGCGGIGRGIALGLAAEGMDVIAADIELASAEGVEGEIRARGGSATAVAVDATDRRSLTALADGAVTRRGPLHVVVNAMGVIVDRRLDAATEADWAWVVEFNLMAHVRTNDVFLPLLRANGQGGHIVNTSSMAGLLALGPEAVGGFANGLYTTTKHAVIGYCAMLRAELAPEGIGVSVLCPGLVVGNLAATSARNRPDRHGGPMRDQRGDRPPPPSAMPNEDVGPIVARGIRANRATIFTHTDPGVAALLRARNDELDADLAWFAAQG